MSKKMLGVLYGSRSCEHEVSIISAVQLMRAVNREEFDVTPVYITQQGEWYTGEKLMDLETYNHFDPYRSGLKRVSLDLTAGSGALLHYTQGKGLFRGLTQEVVARIDCFIPVLHGLHGEDGSIQGLLELANIPYTSTGILGSAIGMDKIAMKTFFKGMSFPTLPGIPVLRSEYRNSGEKTIARIEKELGYPVIVKPASLGSSIGVSWAKDRASLIEALQLSFQYDRRTLVEKGLDHPIEVNCSVLGFDGKAETSALEMPLSQGDVLDFAEKYLGGTSSTKGMASMSRVLDPDLGEALSEKIRSLAKEIFHALDCKGVVRVDFMIDRGMEELYITEINTIPGSLSFYLWDKANVRYAELISRMVSLAEQAQREKDENNYAYRSDILHSVKLGGTKGAKKLG